MTHYRSMFTPNEANKNYLFAYDLDGKEHTLVIERVTQGELTGEQGRKKKVPTLYFKGAKKALGLNITNAKAIAAMYGVEVKAWVGKSITIYPTTTEFNKQRVECVRVKPGIPQRAGESGEALNDVAPPANAMTEAERAEILNKEKGE